jgi:hypothetical protein
MPWLKPSVVELNRVCWGLICRDLFEIAAKDGISEAGPRCDMRRRVFEISEGFWIGLKIGAGSS